MEGMEWLSQLKVGDKVIISRAHWGSKVSTVEKITPTEMIKVDKRMFNKDGRERGNRGYSGFPQASLVEATEDSIQKAKITSGLKW